MDGQFVDSRDKEQIQVFKGLLAYTQSKHIHVDLEHDNGARYKKFMGDVK